MGDGDVECIVGGYVMIVAPRYGGEFLVGDAVNRPVGKVGDYYSGPGLRKATPQHGSPQG